METELKQDRDVHVKTKACDTGCDTAILEQTTNQ